LQPGYDIVIVARSSIIGQSFVDVQRAIHQMFQQANLIKDKA